MRRSVVITGIGTVSALGVGHEPLWEGLKAGKSGLARISQFDASGFPCAWGGEVKDSTGSARGFSAKDFVPKSYRKSIKVMARDTELAVAAARLAVDDAKIATRGTLAEGEGPATYPSERMGCHIGAGLIAAETDELTSALATAVDSSAPATQASGFSLAKWGTAEGGGGGMNNLQPLWMLKYLPNMLACHVTIIHGAEGPSNTLTNAETSGLLCLGESTRVIARGAADLCFSGGAESKVNLLGLLRLDHGGRVAHVSSDATPSDFLRPFAPDSAGGVPGEAGGILIVEEEQAARARGASVYARVSGFGAAQSHSRVVPSLEGRSISSDGLELAMNSALRDASATPDQIDAIVPLGSGVPAMDAAEAGAIRRVFSTRAEKLPLLCLSPAMGDAAAGIGGVQVAAAALTLKRQDLPMGCVRTLAGARHSGGGGPSRIRRILVCALGLGGQNAALVLDAV